MSLATLRQRPTAALVLLACLSCVSTPIGFGQTTKPKVAARITGGPTSGIVAVGDTVNWTIECPDANADAGEALRFKVRQGNAKTIQEGTLEPGQASLAVPVKIERDGWMYLEVYRVVDTKNVFVTSAGVITPPETFAPAVPKPDDFDSFWRAEVAKVTAVPPNAALKPIDSEKPGVQLFDVTLDNVDGAHVRAQLARPENGEKLPAVLVYQYAGVYALKKEFATGLAAQGWLVLNVMAHDLPIHEPKAFYDAQNAGPLRGYPSIGSTSRDTSYFRKMLLADYQAIQYLITRPDWDGRTLVARGESQGALQAFAMAALHPKVTALTVVVPAGADTLGHTVGRQAGWPFWNNMNAARRDEVLSTSRYFDTVNFAAGVKVPSLVTVALRDNVAPPPGIIAAFNQIVGPRELFIEPDGPHSAGHDASRKRHAAWMNSLRTTGQPPERTEKRQAN